jgi:hypothetical protein
MIVLPAISASPTLPTPPALPSWASRLEASALPYVHATTSWTKHALHWASSHTGLPIIVIAVLASVLAARVVRRTWLAVLEVALAFALIFAATRLGWIRW